MAADTTVRYESSMTEKKDRTKKRRGELTGEQKAFIVTELACYTTPQQVVKLFEELFGIKLARQRVEYYDPTKACGRTLGKTWADMFYSVRETFLKHVEDHVPIAHRAVRLRKMAFYLEHFEKAGNLPAALDVLERAAKEVGNVHTNRREHTGKSGGPIQFEDMTDDQLDAEILRLIGISSEAEPDGDAATQSEPTRH